MFKKCFGCQLTLPLFMYKKVKEGDYSIKSALGRVCVCKVCHTRRFLREGSVWHRVDKKWYKVESFKQFIKVV